MTLCPIPKLYCPEAEFPCFAQGDGQVTLPNSSAPIGLVAHRAVWPFFVIVSAPSLQLVRHIRKGQEPVLVQALCAEAAVEGFNNGVVGQFAGSREIQNGAAQVTPDVQVALGELAALVQMNSLQIADHAAHPVERQSQTC